MKKVLFALLIVGTLSCSNAQKSEFSKAAMTESLVDRSGTNIQFAEILKKHKGKTLIIEVWASWCGDCVKAMPKLRELQANHPEADYVFISMDKAKDKWEAGIERHKLEGDHYWSVEGMKGKFAKAIDLDWIPRYIIIDKNGQIVTYRAIETDFDAMNTTLNQLK